jgi:hypothetical protein
VRPSLMNQLLGARVSQRPGFRAVTESPLGSDWDLTKHFAHSNWALAPVLELALLEAALELETESEQWTRPESELRGWIGRHPSWWTSSCRLA